MLFGDQYELLWNGIDAKSTTLISEDYFVRGATALLDAVGKTIIDVGRRLAQESKNQRPNKVLFAITTDGIENSGCEFTYKKVKGLIKHQQKKERWEFLF